ncbi:MAG: flagellar filament capping protein FliD [Actinobacteria bacterium]|nr:flagellar filament capping protein FliD [Actinomycetota bacterium]
MAIDGLASGLDTNNIINQLMEIERIPVNQMLRRQAKAQAAADAYASISAKLTSVTNAANALERANDWTLTTASTSNAALATATAGVGAGAGTLTFTVEQTAAAHTITSAPVADRSTSMTTQNPGSVSLTINGQETTLAVGSGTIDEIAGAINNAALGIRATVVNVGPGGFRLQMSSNTTGASSQFTVDGLATPAGETAPSVVTATGRDAVIRIGEGAGSYTVSSSSNTFADVMTGVTITAKAVSSDAVTVTVERDGKALSDRVKTLASAVNDALAEIKKQTAYDAATGTASSLTGDVAARQATQNLTRAITEAIAQSPLYSGANVGISVDRFGTVTFDEAKFVEAYNADPQAVERMFTQGGAATLTGSGAATQDIAFVGAGNRLAGGDYNVVVTQAATRAREVGMVGPYPVTNPTTIRVKVGLTELVVAIGHDPDSDIDLADHAGGVSAQAITSALNDKLSDAKLNITASTDGGSMELTANGYGSSGSFEVDWGSGYLQAAGLDVQGTIGGTVARGVGQTLSLDTTDGELSGISLRTGAPGDFTVTYEPGIAQRLLGAVSNATDSRFGYLVKAKEARETQIGNIKKSTEQYELRLDARELRLRAQFAALETMLGSLNSSASMLSAMTSSLDNNKSKR